MKKHIANAIVSLFLFACILNAATNDFVFYQVPASGPLTKKLVAPGTSKLLGFGSSASTPVVISLGSGLSLDTSTNTLTASGSGTVTSVALSAPSILSVAGSPVTTSGTIALSLSDQAANTIFAGPATGVDAAPTFRALVADDIPSMTSAELKGRISDETGTGALVFANGSLGSPNATQLSVSGALTSGSNASLAETGGTLFVGSSSTEGGVLALVEGSAAGNSNWVGFKSPASVAADCIFTLPAADGSSGHVLKTNGSKVLSFGAIADDTAYDAGSWNANSNAPTKNAVRDKFESLSSGGGKVLQMVYATKLDTATGTDTTFATFFSASITPTSATSRIIATYGGGVSGTSNYLIAMRIARGSTAVHSPASPGSRAAGNWASLAGGTATMLNPSVSVIDEPATTSSTTYNVQIQVEAGGTYYINRSSGDSDSAAYPRTTSQIILMEVAP